MGEINPHFLLGGYAHATTLCFLPPSRPWAAHNAVYSVVLVSTMFALRLVPRGVAKKGVISKKRGIPRYIPHK